LSVVLSQPYTSNIYLSDVAVDDFLVIVVDDRWWIGRALEVDNEGDVVSGNQIKELIFCL
jgi:hypothetical protein